MGDLANAYKTTNELHGYYKALLCQVIIWPCDQCVTQCHFFLAVFFRVAHDGLSERGTTRSLWPVTRSFLPTFSLLVDIVVKKQVECGLVLSVLLSTTIRVITVVKICCGLTRLRLVSPQTFDPSDDAYSLSIRVQTTLNHIRFVNCITAPRFSMMMHLVFAEGLNSYNDHLMYSLTRLASF